MGEHFFLSYSAVDVALSLADKLAAGPPGCCRDFALAGATLSGNSPAPFPSDNP